MLGKIFTCCPIESALRRVSVTLASTSDGKIRNTDPLLFVRDWIDGILNVVFVGIGVGIGFSQLNPDKLFVFGHRHGLRTDQLLTSNDVQRWPLKLILLNVFCRRCRCRRLNAVLFNRRHLKCGKHDTNVSRCDPVLQDGAVLEVFGARSICQSGERDSGRRVVIEMRVETESLLFIGASDWHLDVALEDGAAVGRVKLNSEQFVVISFNFYMV